MSRTRLFFSVVIAVLTFSMNCNASKSISGYECAITNILNDNGSSDQTSSNKTAKIYQLFKSWRNAIKESDPKKIASLVTKDAEFWSNGAPPLKGRLALENAFRPFLAKFIFSQEYECYELIVRGDIAFIRGLEHNKKIPREGGPPIITKQRAFSVIRQTKDGKWLFARGMTNLPKSL